MLKTLLINDWEKWQSYRTDRGTPPWIKIHRCIFSNQKWAVLSDAEKGQLVSIWVLGADNNGTVPADPTLIQKMCMLDSKPNINKFIELNFLTANGLDYGVNVASTWRQDDSPETETETETEKKKHCGQKRFVHPSLDEVKAYCAERKNTVDPEKWMDFYTSNGWKVGRNLMKDWKAAVRTWEKNGINRGGGDGMKATTVHQANMVARDHMAKMLNDEADNETRRKSCDKDLDSNGNQIPVRRIHS